jgi:DNA modification methylase
VPHFLSEFIWAFKKTPGLKWRNWKTTVFSIANLTCGCVSTGERLTKKDGTALHPTQKPVKLMKDLLSIADEDMIILDPFAGTGSTLVAAELMGMNYIGIEQDEKYVEIARKRVQKAKDSMGLFSQEIK